MPGRCSRSRAEFGGNDYQSIPGRKLERAGKEDSLARAFGAVAADFRPRGKAVFQFLEDTLACHGESALQKAAAKSLSMTNLPKAVEVLTRYYGDSNLIEVVREALVRMGDLAVPKLESIAEEDSESAMDALVKIGTPHAVEVLEKLNDNPEPIISTGTLTILPIKKG